MSQHKKGEIVTIYKDPFSQLRPEGKAKLVKLVDGFDSDTLEVLERWEVEFLDEPGKTFERWI